MYKTLLVQNSSMKSKLLHFLKTPISSLVILLLGSLLSACVGHSPWLPSSGPTAVQMEDATQSKKHSNIRIVDVDAAVANKLLASQKQNLFSEAFKKSIGLPYVVGAGDVLEVSIWEAPPAVLFSNGLATSRVGLATTSMATLPEQMVSGEGTINIPFAGQLIAAGRNTQQIETEIVRLLKKKANQPQALVRVVRNNTANVTVVGEVTSSVRMPLTARGERLLDALAAAGGVRHPINKMTLQVTRGQQVQSLPLETIIRDPKQNIVLQSGDVVTSLFQPFSFSVLGATAKNEEVNFEGYGISLAQALARVGGLQDQRADARGVFVFRFESPTALEQNEKSMPLTAEGKIPVIYRIDFKDPATFFVAQNFPIQNKDVLYVSNAPAAELQKFLNIVGSIFYPVATGISLAK